jgi:hypothetical protein
MVRPLVAVRQKTPFEPGVFRNDPIFWPLERAVAALGRLDDFPSLEALARVFEGEAPVRFVRPVPRGRRGPVDAAMLYDARIALEGLVPTRERCWHDFINALVWGTFPRAKRALHARQHRLVAERIVPGARGLPPRSAALDGLALLDEGGVAVMTPDVSTVEAALRSRDVGSMRSLIQSGAAEALVFGHALYESVALGVRPAVVAAVVLRHDGVESDLVRAADAALATALDDGARFRSPRDLVRVHVGEIVRRPVQNRPAADSP